MATTIKLKNSVTTTNTPSSLAQGEVAINITDKKVWVGNAATTPVQIVGAGTTGNAAGSNTQVQYNSSGSFAGSANFTFNGTTVTMANDASISGLTVGKGGGAVSTNTSVGASALASNSSSGSMTAVGYQALYSATSGQNTAVGSQSFYTNGAGGYNTGIGVQSGYLNTSGSYNTALGHSALYSNTTANGNTAVGYQAGYSNTTGEQNTFVGFTSGQLTTTGINNSAFGYNSLKNNTTGQLNVAVGHGALLSNTTGSYNTVLGYQAGYLGTTRGDSTFIGALAGYNTTGGSNVFVGYGAGYNATSGTNNTFIGIGAGENMTTGSKNTILGKYNGNQGGLDIRTASNYIVLSDGDGNPRCHWNNVGQMTQDITAAGANAFSVYNRSTTGYGIACLVQNDSSNTYRILEGYSLSASAQRIVIYTNGDVKNTNNSYGSLSDIKLKQDIVDAKSQWDDIKALRVRKYRFKNNPNGQLQIGLIAQETELVSAGLIEESPDEERDENGKVIGFTGETTKSIKYSVLYMKAIKALQEAMERIEVLEAKVQQLENK